ncbi:MAG: hypothetical protein IMZ55_04940 [Acidobacteria bacterium]|nr:hypothetical protein [Acidobacteriota bacterium]
MNIDPITLAWLVPVTTAVVQVLRSAVKVLAEHSGVLPVVSMGVGIVLSVVTAVAWPPADVAWASSLAQASIQGLIAGLTASGLYSVAVQPVVKAVSQ